MSKGVVEMMLDATQNYRAPLTDERLFGWHAALFPTGRSGMTKIAVGAWRTTESGPMQVVSGPIGREHVHFEAPAARSASRRDAAPSSTGSMPPTAATRFFAAMAHLWFVTIHPFEDGNGRIARAIADMALARSEGTPQRFYSMSSQIRIERKAYYDILERTQKGDLDITDWIALVPRLPGSRLRAARRRSSPRFCARRGSGTPMRATQFNDRQRSSSTVCSTASKAS